MLWTLSVSEPWFSAIKLGEKKYEGRLCRGIPGLIRVGDKIHIFKENSGRDTPHISTTVISVEVYRTFRDGLLTLGLDDTLPGVSDIEQGVQIYQEFSSLSSQKTHGVVFIKLHVD